MNDYTRREEVRWTLVAAALLVLCIGAALVLLMTAQGKIVPDPAARAAAKDAEAQIATAKSCAVAAEKLVTEVDVFRASAKTARLGAEPDAGAPPAKPGPKGKKEKDKAPDVELAWGTAQPSYKQAKALAGCRALADAAVPGRADAKPAWEGIEKAAAIAPPAEGDKNAQVDASRKLLAAFGDAPMDKAATHAKDAEAAVRAAAEAAAKRADGATVREALPAGLLPREIAIIVGVSLSLLALLVSYLSVRSVSNRRMSTLLPLRRGNRPGLQAAAILKLAAQHNGGEPGLVMGAALGGLLAAVLRPVDADLFVAGVMAGLPMGLLLQWAVRLAGGMGPWRTRAAELADTEKPTLAIVLVLSGVNPGLEAQFMQFFDGLGPNEAAETVEKLAAQAEERILAAADAGRPAYQPGQAPAQQPPGPPQGGYGR